MKRYNQWLLVILTASLWGMADSALAEEWGVITNGVQISICLVTNQPIKTNEPVVISFRIGNTLTNESLCFYYWGSPEASFTYKITTPSGKEPSRNTDVIMTGFSTGPMWISPKETQEYKANLSLLYNFNEVGTYKIVGRLRMESRTTMVSQGDTTFDDNKAFEAISSPLNLTVASGK